MRSLVLAAGLAFLAPVAWGCPVGSDIDKGIRFTVDDVDTEEYRRIGPGMIEAVYSASDGLVTRNLLAQGVYLVELVDLVEGVPDQDTRVTYAFPGRAEELAVPEPGGQVTYDVAINNLGDLDKERQIYDFGPLSKINFGACEYDLIPIEIRYEPDDSGTVDLLYYLPAFGFSYYAGSDYTDGSDRYNYSDIEVIE
ncbi:MULTISPECIES: hypothetical protein [Mameliella]|uniref:hypothetical protein n=1 Tax=Mameliella TaxID=1434019 RepID=UPI000841101D|nr:MULTISPECIES: hypothetical protein [Mameliella]MBV6637057.1 hypothetical protein [Mameliella sp.]ODM48761.1 hypothetical protein A9320_03525 [Ruegeria sp. PBVC088]MBY6118753.1 hypothetical protein [Mameliella alba]MDD9731809.1 hypothetical protein [Mameliella sp. AT18]OWV43691.1 hypothetical protein CDZ95_08445 [Mameliella alba]